MMRPNSFSLTLRNFQVTRNMHFGQMVSLYEHLKFSVHANIRPYTTQTTVLMMIIVKSYSGRVARPLFRLSLAVAISALVPKGSGRLTISEPGSNRMNKAIELHQTLFPIQIATKEKCSLIHNTRQRYS